MRSPKQHIHTRVHIHIHTCTYTQTSSDVAHHVPHITHSHNTYTHQTHTQTQTNTIIPSLPPRPLPPPPPPPQDRCASLEQDNASLQRRLLQLEGEKAAFGDTVEAQRTELQKATDRLIAFNRLLP